MSLAAILDVPARIAAAIKKASQATGADFDYLLKTAARESGFRAEATSRTSSAAGPFQFIENTWLRMVKAEGHRYGLGHLADAIVEDARGRCRVADPAARAEILKLRHDPEMSALMAGAFTRQNADYMAGKLGRAPTEGELYIAHFLGAPRGARFVQMAEARPDLRADVYFAREARANRSIFYEGGKPRTLAEVYETLVSRHCGTPLARAARGVAPPPSRSPAAVGPAPTPPAAKAFAPVKVAALAHKTLQIAPETANDAGPGGIGSWRTIVLPGPTGEPRASRGAEVPARTEPVAIRERRALPSAPAHPPPLPRRAPAAPSVPAAAVSPAPRLNVDSTLLQAFGDDFRGRVSGG